MGEGITLAGGAGAQQELRHRGTEAHADGAHLGSDELHGVVDRHAGRDRPSGRVDVEPDRLFGVLRLEEQHLGDELVGHVVVDVGAEEHHPVLEEAVEDVEPARGFGVEVGGGSGGGNGCRHVQFGHGGEGSGGP